MIKDKEKFRQWLLSLNIAELSAIVHTSNVLDAPAVAQFVTKEEDQVTINDFLDDVYRMAEMQWAMRLVGEQEVT